jgi:hypothetical protein
METVEGGYTFAPDRRWQTFLRSRTLAAILLAGCVFGVLAILTSAPFGTSASERISAKIGNPVTCESVGDRNLAGRSATVYRCQVETQKATVTQCFAVSGSRVDQLIGSRKRAAC